jgi:hypothetical protein
VIFQGTRLAAVVERASSGDVFETPEEFGHVMMKLARSVIKK